MYVYTSAQNLRGGMNNIYLEQGALFIVFRDFLLIHYQSVSTN